VFAAA
jgi:multidrug efflux pump subunit AcrA (membrane-fusion protein)